MRCTVRLQSPEVLTGAVLPTVIAIQKVNLCFLCELVQRKRTSASAIVLLRCCRLGSSALAAKRSDGARGQKNGNLSCTKKIGLSSLLYI